MDRPRRSGLAFDKLGEHVALEHAESQSESIASRQALADLETQRHIRKLEAESGLLTVERNQALERCVRVTSVSSPPKSAALEPSVFLLADSACFQIQRPDQGTTWVR